MVCAKAQDTSPKADLGLNGRGRDGGLGHYTDPQTLGLLLTQGLVSHGDCHAAVPF